MQMLGLMNYITSIMRWQNVGNRTGATAAGNASPQISFEERLRQSVQREVKGAVGKDTTDCTVGGEQKSAGPMEIMQIINPYQNLAMMSFLNLLQ